MGNLHTCFRAGDSNGRTGYSIGFHYDLRAVETLKRSVPHTEREWDKVTKLWWVSEEYESALIDIFSNFYALVHQQGRLI